MIEVDFELDQRLQAEEQGEITIKERSRLFVELMEKRKKHFAALRAQEKQVRVKKHQGDDDQEEAEMKRHIEIVKDDEVAIDAIPLATKPLVIVDYKIDKDGSIGYFKLIRDDGSSKDFINDKDALGY
ncbi:hypothetical protein Tco_0269018 [Tanacetum coccineum]